MDLKNAVAISYAQENPKYIEKVMGFVDLLRRKYGYNAVMDQMLKQEQTAIDFNEMMSKLIADSEKVIVVLSHTYKKKADAFESGVGKEYRIILDQIDKKSKKYIFITFESLKEVNIDDIKPSGIGNREILDFSEGAEQWDNLLSKLSDIPIYQFSEVAKEKKQPRQKILRYQRSKSKKEIFRSVQILLAENEQIFKQYGPLSLNARNNPLSHSVDMWKKKKIDTIIPNNKKIVDLFEKNISIFSIEEMRIYTKFKIHAEAFEACQMGLLDAKAAPTFPQEFELMINSEE